MYEGGIPGKRGGMRSSLCVSASASPACRMSCAALVHKRVTDVPMYFTATCAVRQVGKKYFECGVIDEACILIEGEVGPLSFRLRAEAISSVWGKGRPASAGVGGKAGGRVCTQKCHRNITKCTCFVRACTPSNQSACWRQMRRYKMHRCWTFEHLTMPRWFRHGLWPCTPGCRLSSRTPTATARREFPPAMRWGWGWGVHRQCGSMLSGSPHPRMQRLPARAPVPSQAGMRQAESMMPTERYVHCASLGVCPISLSITCPSPPPGG